MILVETVLEKRGYRSFYWKDSLSIASWRFDIAMAVSLVFLADMAMKLVAGNWTGAILPAALVAIVLIWFFLERRNTLNKHLKLLDIPLYRNKILIRFEISPKKIVSQNKKNGRMETVKWSQVRKVAQNKKYLFLYVDKHSAMIIAKQDIKQGSAQELLEYWKQEQERRIRRKGATKVIEG